MRSLLLVSLLVAACGSDKPATESTNPSAPAAPALPTTDVGSAPASPASFEQPPGPSEMASDAPLRPADTPSLAGGGHDFTAEGRALLAVGACGDGTAPPEISAAQLEAHCAVIRKTQDDYATKWVAPARAFFAEKVPKGVPGKVVYPFAGGDLSTALTVYPDADEITTLSLEPAGDPRTLGVLQGKDLTKALAKVQYELRFLYKVNFSNTLNMIEAMRGGALPTELIFGLSALKLHGFELVALRYFNLGEDGSLQYLTHDEVRAAPDPANKATAQKRNMVFANAEVQFRRPGGRVQVWRHIRKNLGDRTSKGIGDGLAADGRTIKHLEAKGPIAGMTKAASYLLSWDSFSIIRGYLLRNVMWMVSDATGVAPKWGKPAGFEYETYGMFQRPHISAGDGIAKDWRTEFEAQQQRPLRFRFGYYDKSAKNHLIIMRRKS
jgi:hypothetical protein